MEHPQIPPPMMTTRAVSVILPAQHRTMRSISTSDPKARLVTPTVVRAGKRPVSQFQTPTAPRSAVGFFGFGHSTDRSIELDHPAYFGLALN